MDTSLKPIYALADSRLLFWKRPDGTPFLNDVVQSVGSKPISVAYIGASNGDDLSTYHEIFEPAMQQLSDVNCRMILAHPMPEDGTYLEHAEMIVLAGGSVEVGWRAFEANGFKDLIRRRWYEGALLIGVSAGAVQLGRGGLSDDGSQLLSTFCLLPFYVGAHEERNNWESLRKALKLAPENSRGIGIPSGGGLVYEGGEVTPICQPIFEISMEEDKIVEDTVFPMSN